MNKVYRFVKDIVNYFQQGIKFKLKKVYLKNFLKLLVFYLSRFRVALEAIQMRQIRAINEPNTQKLKRTVQGLHSLLPPNPLYTYSILITLDNPNPVFLKKALEAVLNQTSGSIEILIGSTEEIDQEIKDLLQNREKIKYFKASLNELAEKAVGNFLFLMGQEDWIRPDLLFRYEQTLRLMDDPENSVLSCHENKINALDFILPLSEEQKTIPQFPYIFHFFGGPGLLIPKKLWTGICPQLEGAQFADLLLRLHLAGAHFQHIPIPLYSKRAGSEKKISIPHFIQSLTDYTSQKKLNWNWIPGYCERSVRALPETDVPHEIQIIIPFKDQKELTLKCIQSLMKQKGVSYKITAVNNCSHDKSIADELKNHGVEVIEINEPFNYSRLNNLAIKLTQTASACDLVLFLNNDVELEENALEEMVRWIDQPHIGMVGCRLHYPNGLLQHGGIYIDDFQSDNQAIRWYHAEKMLPFKQLNVTKRLGIVPAVTAACAMMKKSLFLELGGFDEIWYPIGYSDTNLAAKVSAKGLYSFYTPYASGIHHESVTRKEGIEDFESSKWLHDLVMQKVNSGFELNAKMQRSKDRNGAKG